MKKEHLILVLFVVVLTACSTKILVNGHRVSSYVVFDPTTDSTMLVFPQNEKIKLPDSAVLIGTLKLRGKFQDENDNLKKYALEEARLHGGNAIKITSYYTVAGSAYLSAHLKANIYKVSKSVYDKIKPKLDSFYRPLADADTTILAIKKCKVQTSYFPYNKVIVLDNRLDTNRAGLSGIYGENKITLPPPTAAYIHQQIEKATSKLRKGNKTLLINLYTLRCPNALFLHRKRGTITYLRNYVMCYADLYIQTANNRYRKFITVDMDCQKNHPLDRILTKIIDASYCGSDSLMKYNIPLNALFVLHDTGSFHYCADTTSHSIAEINTNIKNTWANYAIVKADYYRNGFYRTFEDFRNNHSHISTIRLKGENDSISQLYIGDGRDSISKEHEPPFAVCLNNNLYMHLEALTYIRLHKQGNTFWFYIPYPYPNMYTANALMQQRVMNRGYTAISTGHLLPDLAATAIVFGIEAAFEKSMENRILQGKDNSKFRRCFIDMSNGDQYY